MLYYKTIVFNLAQPFEKNSILKKQVMSQMKKKLFLALMGLITLSCSKEREDENENLANCDFEILISAEQYADAPSDHLTINSLTIDDNCLKISFSSRGCDGDTWELQLIDSEDFLESDPPQRNLRLSLNNEELCLAYITKEMSFDISSLQEDGNKLQLNLTNSDQSIVYEY